MEVLLLQRATILLNGIMDTKVYGPDGGQLPPKEADELVGFVNAVENELTLAVQSEAGC